YSSPGSSTEFVYLYVGIADLGATQTHGGLSEEDEDIRSQVLSFDALMQALDSNQFHDLPLFSLALWLARHRDRLRLMA
ncbi:MAG: ADP-ribose pyrophosphatase, partial [Paracoccaceae bacterium]